MRRPSLRPPGTVHVLGKSGIAWERSVSLSSPRPNLSCQATLEQRIGHLLCRPVTTPQPSALR